MLRERNNSLLAAGAATSVTNVLFREHPRFHHHGFADPVPPRYEFRVEGEKKGVGAGGSFDEYVKPSIVLAGMPIRPLIGRRSNPGIPSPLRDPRV